MRQELNVELNVNKFTFDELTDAWAKAYVDQITGCVNQDPEYLATNMGGREVLNTLKKWVEVKLDRHDLDSYFDRVWKEKVAIACQ